MASEAISEHLILNFGDPLLSPLHNFPVSVSYPNLGLSIQNPWTATFATVATHMMAMLYQNILGIYIYIAF